MNPPPKEKKKNKKNNQNILRTVFYRYRLIECKHFLPNQRVLILFFLNQADLSNYLKILYQLPSFLVVNVPGERRTTGSSWVSKAPIRMSQQGLQTHTDTHTDTDVTLQIVSLYWMLLCTQSNCTVYYSEDSSRCFKGVDFRGC